MIFRVAAVVFHCAIFASALARADIQNVWVPVSDPGSPEAAAAPVAPGPPMAFAPQTPVMAGPAPDGAVSAMLAVDPKYVDGIVLVTARGGTPVPGKWTVVARDDQDLGTLHKLTVADGQVIADVQSMNAYEAFRQDVAINPQQVPIDSGDAFAIAQPIAAANQKIIGRADYALTVRGTDAAPIWTVNCFDIRGGYCGQVVLLATTGEVLSHSGFRNLPSR